MSNNTRAIFLDRDGTLNSDEKGYTHKTEELEFLPGVIEALKLLKDDFIFIVITNQSGIGRGYYSIEDAKKFNNRMQDELKKHGIDIKRFYICPHLPEDACACRKPNPSTILDARDRFNIDLKASFVIGDHPSDVKLGHNAGCKSIYLLTGHGRKHQNELKDADYVADSLPDAAAWIMSRIGNLSKQD